MIASAPPRPHLGPTSEACKHATGAVQHSREQFWDGARVALGELQAGDLVFYASDVLDPATIHHLGLYLGGGRMTEAVRAGTFIRYASIDRPGYIGAVRPIVPSAVGAT